MSIKSVNKSDEINGGVEMDKEPLTLYKYITLKAATGHWKGAHILPSQDVSESKWNLKHDWLQN